MRPFRSFLLLFFTMAFLSGLFYIFREQTPGSVPDTEESPPDTTLSDEPAPADPLAPFLDSLTEGKGQVRIMYYGDSQIEGDRVTSHLRQLLRCGRGGTGSGLFLPSMPVMYTKSIWLRSSANWQRYNSISYRSGELTHNRLGPFMTICRYLPEGEISPDPVKAFIRIRPSVFADSAVAVFEIMRLLYANSQGEVKVTVKADDKQVFTGLMENGEEIKEIRTSLNGADDIMVEFEGRNSPDILGISIESRTGIIIDNIPRRGSAGLEFTLVDRDNLKESLRMLSPDLVVL